MMYSLDEEKRLKIVMWKYIIKYDNITLQDRILYAHFLSEYRKFTATITHDNPRYMAQMIRLNEIHDRLHDIEHNLYGTKISRCISKWI